MAVVARNARAGRGCAEPVAVDFEELPAVTDMESALDPATPVIHPDLGDNLCFERKLEAGDVDARSPTRTSWSSETFRFGRHTGVTLEPRAILADYDPADAR